MVTVSFLSGERATRSSLAEAVEVSDHPLTPKEFAAILNCSVHPIYQLAHTRELSVPVGDAYVFDQRTGFAVDSACAVLLARNTGPYLLTIGGNASSNFGRSSAFIANSR